MWWMMFVQLVKKVITIFKENYFIYLIRGTPLMMNGWIFTAFFEAYSFSLYGKEFFQRFFKNSKFSQTTETTLHLYTSFHLPASPEKSARLWPSHAVWNKMLSIYLIGESFKWISFFTSFLFLGEIKYSIRCINFQVLLMRHSGVLNFLWQKRSNNCWTDVLLKSGLQQTS